VSDAFTQKNIRVTVAESLDVFDEVVENFRTAKPNGWIRGYVSTAFECPYAGWMDPAKVLDVCLRLIEIGVDELSLGDTIGVASPKEVRVLTKMLLSEIPKEKIAYHFHDTCGTAVANVACALEDGIEIFDSSAGGLGGCPYAPGAGGNLATEDLIYFLEREGLGTGVDLSKLAQASMPVLQLLGRSPSAKAQLAVLARCEPGGVA
jgi:hydroxymethylglutaryl-CoA lyase